MSYDRCWLEETGSEDSHGRALWGLGVAATLGRNNGQLSHAADLFQRALPAVENFTSPRAVAFTVIGIHAFLSGNRDNSQVETLCRILSDKLFQPSTETSSNTSVVGDCSSPRLTISTNSSRL